MQKKELKVHTTKMENLGQHLINNLIAKFNKIITFYNQSKISQLQTEENIIIKLITAKTEKQLKTTFKQYVS